MKLIKKNAHLNVYILLLSITLIQISCDSDNDDSIVIPDSNLITISQSEINFGEVVQNTSGKNQNEISEVTLTLTNNSDEILNSLGASIEFPGSVSVNLSFSPLDPGESIDVPFTFAPGNLEPGIYTGTATLTPSIGEPLEVKLEATVIAASDNAGKISLSSNVVDFGEVTQSTSGKNQNEVSEVTLTLTNNSNEILQGLASSIEFPGSVSVKLSFSPLAPGESIDVPFTFAPGNLQPGIYTGKATLTPSIGEPLAVELKATVI
ncbi:hypothetical protein [Aquimarina sp. 2201CG14-23]|uniref:hypothetical protein n=1 Tax=Aquimarina mycalae TaxID=3040073 RepID=UPI002478137A|nr:hypothetical protein [Aquimarina sp. 2201CG14-23]MDH7445932.1 hypothetical protein [Aquimarina sp. 2201CG14-23]